MNGVKSKKRNRWEMGGFMYWGAGESDCAKELQLQGISA